MRRNITLGMVATWLAVASGSPMYEAAHHGHDHLGSQPEFEELLSDTSAAILAAPVDRVEEAVGRALANVRAFFQADRCALLTVSADLRRVKARIGSSGDGVPPVPAVLDLARLFPWARQHLLVERSPARAGTFADLPPEAATDRAGWERLGMVSCLTLPIVIGGEIRHMILLQTMREERRWADSLVVRLRVLGELLASALDRQEMVAGLRRAEARLRSDSRLGRRLVMADEAQRTLAIPVDLSPQVAAGRREATTPSPRAGRGGADALTPRQREVLRLLAEGRSAKEVAFSLDISVRTVEFHKYRVMGTLGLGTRAELMRFAIKHGLVEL